MAAKNLEKSASSDAEAIKINVAKQPDPSIPRGFAGLQSMRSDVDLAITAVARAKPEPAVVAAAEAPKSATAHSTPQPGWQSVDAKPPSSKKGWWWAVAGVVGLLWFLGSQDGKSKSSFAPNSAGQVTSSYNNVESWTESKPPASQGAVYNRDQIRYCVAEDIRIQTMEPIINRSADIEIDGFNAFVADYNSRCSSYRYRQGSLESVQRDAANRRAVLQSEARQRVYRWRAQSRVEPSAKQWEKSAAAPVVAQSTLRQAPRPAVVSTKGKPGANERPTLTRSELSADEETAIESACSSAKYLKGPAEYKVCIEKQLASVAGSPRNVDVSWLTSDEQTALESACSSDKFLKGPAAYNRCVKRHTSALRHSPRDTYISWLNSDEMIALDAACSSAKFLEGPSAYNSCVARNVSDLRKLRKNIGMTHLTSAQKDEVDSACLSAKFLKGPAAYNQCLSRQVASKAR